MNLCICFLLPHRCNKFRMTWICVHIIIWIEWDNKESSKRISYFHLEMISLFLEVLMENAGVEPQCRCRTTQTPTKHQAFSNKKQWFLLRVCELNYSSWCNNFSLIVWRTSFSVRISTFSEVQTQPERISCGARGSADRSATGSIELPATSRLSCGGASTAHGEAEVRRRVTQPHWKRADPGPV